ncbi:hypothetical protein BJ944DRAFT_263113 [Cunninghamella echinulata]|nr:hypothetical protein BJ944DRAFT_263113 [Cunninghamella echinulata]
MEKTLFCLLFLLYIAIVIASPVSNCVCDGAYKPVCGTDQKVYGNPCEAKCNGVEVCGIPTDGKCGVC